jgi:hypothetical protein
MAVWDAWPTRFERSLSACEKLGGECRDFVFEPPATAEELQAVERALGRSIPKTVATVFTGFSRKLTFSWFLPDDFHLPEPFDGIFCGGADWGLDAIPRLDEDRQSWVAEVFPNPDDPYDAVWHRVISFMEVGNGDILAIDSAQGDDGPVVYADHDGGDFHGARLGLNFIDFIDRWSKLGCVGAEDWQMKPFVSDAAVLDPEGEAAHKWRELFGMSITE